MKQPTKTNEPTGKKTGQSPTSRTQGTGQGKSTQTSNPGNPGRSGNAEEYETRTKEELSEKARKAGIEGYNNMDKRELINALKNQ